MNITHTVRLTWTGPGSSSLTGSVVAVDNAEDNRSILLPPLTVGQEVDLDFVISRLKMAFMLTSRDVEIRTNALSAPDDTIALKATVPLWWTATGGAPNPFTDDVQRIFISNVGTLEAQVDLRMLYDSTP